MEKSSHNDSSLHKKDQISSALWDQLLAHIADCIANGEIFITDIHFNQALGKGYENLVKESLTDEIKDQMNERIKGFNEKSPEIFLIPGIENWITSIFVATVRQQQWGIAKIQEAGSEYLHGLLRQNKVKALLGHLEIPPFKINIRKCLSTSLNQVSGRQVTKSKRSDRLSQVQLDGQEQNDEIGQRIIEEQQPLSEPTKTEVEQRTNEQKRIQNDLRKEQIGHLIAHLDAYVEQGKLSTKEAQKLSQLNKVDEAEDQGRISKEKGDRIRNSLTDKKVRYKLDSKVRETTNYAVCYIHFFESMKKIDLKYDPALRLLIRQKEIVNASKEDAIDPAPFVQSLIQDLDCLKLVIELMDRHDPETRMMFARMPPYSYVIKREQDRVDNLVIEEGFVEELRQVDRVEMLSRLNAPEKHIRIKPAVNMVCMYALLQRLVKPTPCRREVRILKINMIVEEFYRTGDNVEEARSKAIEFLNSRLRGLYHPDLTPEESMEIKERADKIIEEVEQRVRAKDKSQEKVSKIENKDDEDLSEEEIAQGVQIGRVALRVAGKTRLMHYKIMPDPDDVEAFVLAQREPETGVMIPVKRGGVKRQVQRASDGSWKLS